MKSIFHSRRNVDRFGHDFSQGGHTVQSDAKDHDLNVIMERYRVSGAIPLNLVRSKQGVYADVSEFGDYRTCLERVAAAQQHFDSLDSRIRDRFQNDPAQFLEFASNPENVSELIDLGLAIEREDSPRKRNSAAPTAPASDSQT